MVDEREICGGIRMGHDPKSIQDATGVGNGVRTLRTHGTEKVTSDGSGCGTQASDAK